MFIIKTCLLLLSATFIQSADVIGPVYTCISSAYSQCILKGIEVTKDQYHFIPTAADVTAVTQVIVSASVIPVLADDICNAFPNLAHLEIQAVEMVEILPNAFDACTKLASLKIINQNIETLDRQVFKNLRNLYSLTLNNNGLRSLPVGIFNELPDLFSLSLSGNNLYDLPVELLAPLKKVDQLWINSNELSDIDEHAIIKALPRLKEIYLNDNDFNCHRVDAILRVLKENGIKGISTTVQRKRFYTVLVIEKIQCLTEAQWSAVYYAKVGQQMTRDLQEIKNVVQVLLERD